MSAILGIDGCRNGWAVAAISDSAISFFTVRRLTELPVPFERIFIDIPIGLPDVGLRSCDAALREKLPSHQKSSVFSCPVRDAVFAADYEEARRISIEKTGKSMSIQAWNICPKVRETAVWLAENPEFKTIVFESHPEWNWQRLAGRSFPSKHSAEGLNARIQFISSMGFEVPKSGKSGMLGVKHNDWLDAACLAISAQRSVELGLLGAEEIQENRPNVYSFNKHVTSK